MAIKHIIACGALLLTAFACGSDDAKVEERTEPREPETPEITETKDGTDFLTFSLKDANGHQTDAFLIDDSCVHITVSPESDLTRLSPVFEHSGAEVLLDSIAQESGAQSHDFSDFTKPLVYRVVSSDGRSKARRIVVHDLPVLVVNTPGGVPITSRSERTEGCTVSLVHTDGVTEELGTAGIRGRGHSTWEEAKKPYDVKLDKKHEVLGMKASKHWILLANCYYDRTQMHNATAFEMARMTDYPWVQSGTHVELILNGSHQGLYYLCEKIRVEKGKIDITRMDTTDLSGYNLTGGYLIESYVLQGFDTDYPFLTKYFNRTGYEFKWSLAWKVNEPDGGYYMPKAQLSYIEASMNRMEKLIYDDDILKTGAYRDSLDIETVINWFLVEESAINEEASRTKNVFMYKDRGGKFRMGPPWDFDAWSFGHAGTERFYCLDRALYYRQLFKDSIFVARLKEKWAEYHPLWEQRIPEFIDTQVARIRRSALRNEQMWNDWISVNDYPSKSYDECIAEMKEDFLLQQKWLDAQFKALSTE